MNELDIIKLVEEKQEKYFQQVVSIFKDYFQTMNQTILKVQEGVNHMSKDLEEVKGQIKRIEDAHNNTKADIKRIETESEKKINKIENDCKERIKALETDFKDEVKKVRQEAFTRSLWSYGVIITAFLSMVGILFNFLKK